MAFYFFITFAVLVITFYMSFLVDAYKIDNSMSGILIALFFLAIMLPGLFLDRIISRLRANLNLVSLLFVAGRLLCCGIARQSVGLAVGCIMAGLGYGIMQPVLYDKAATIAPPRSATLALSFLMAMNYLAVMVCPFVIDGVRDLVGMHGERFPFLLNALLTTVLVVSGWFGCRNFIFGLDESYYKE